MRAFIVPAAIAVLCLVGSERPAMADTSFDCEMKGKWVEAKEDWWFSATYTSKAGDADSFAGNFINAKAGARATITGSASKGLWNIKFTYIVSRAAQCDPVQFGQCDPADQAVGSAQLGLAARSG